MARTWMKPAGVSVFPPHADPDGDCVLAAVLAAEPARAAVAWPDGFAGGIAHRLDVATSGALLLADDPDELARIRAAFAAGAFTKRYVLRAARSPTWDAHHCDRPLAHHPRRKDRMVVQRGRATPHRGRWYEASTRFRRLDGDLWEAVITTGVTHQIRAHAAFLGLPLAGDRQYGGGPTPTEAPPGAAFCLHHAGLDGAGWSTTPVPWPAWTGGAR